MRKKREESKSVVEIGYEGFYIGNEIVIQMGNPERVDLIFSDKEKTVVLQKGKERKISNIHGSRKFISWRKFCGFLEETKWFQGFGCFKYELTGGKLTIFLLERI